MSIRQRVYPTPGQASAMAMHCAHARFVYNLGLEQRRMWRDWRGVGHEPVTAASQQRQLAEIRRATPWLAAGSSAVQQGALRDLDRAYGNFWSNPAHFRPPTWRKAGTHEGFVVRDLAVRHYNRRHSALLVPKVGWVKFRRTRSKTDISKAASARVTLDRSGRWHVSLVCPPPETPRAETGRIVGVDRGVTNTTATTDGDMMHIPNLSDGEKERFVSLQQRLSRQRKESNRRERTRRKLARLHARIADRRRDWVEKTTTELTRDNDIIAIEKLPTKSMTKRPAPKPDPDRPGAFLPNRARAKAALNRAILASCWGMLETRLIDKAEANGATIIITVNPKYTSQKCHHCGHTAPENRKSQAEFQCVKCGHTGNADINAARNILDRGLAKHEAGGRSATGRARPAPAGSVNQQAA